MLPRVGDAGNITKMIVGAFTNQGGPHPHLIRDRFMAFGTLGALVLQGKKNDITKKLYVSHAPHMQWMHCATHQSHLVIQHLSGLEMVSRIETLLIVLHMYFSKSPKCRLELRTLVELLDSKGSKILSNVKNWVY